MLVLNEGKTLEDLDLWPGDTVIDGSDFTVLGTVTQTGSFVSRLSLN